MSQELLELVITESATGLVVEGQTDVIEVGLVGPQGPRGDAGPQGAQGEKGDTGATGATGAQGPQGIQGVKGDKGDKGDTGDVGAQGPAGPTGPQGPQGDAGATGAQGPQGIQGAKGDKGDAGDIGPAGPQGTQGVQGPKGDTGATGPQGPSGVIAVSAPLTNAGTTTAAQLGISQADAAHDGYLSSTDWSAFNSKQSSLGFAPENVTNKDTDVTLSANSDARYASQKAVKTYVDSLIAASDAVVYKGAIDCSANPNFPAADAGHLYVVSAPGKIGGSAGVTVEAGDTLICKADGTAAGTQAAVGANWNVLQTNITYAPEDATNKDTDSTFTANSDTRYPSQKAVKTALASKQDSLGYTPVPNTRTINGHQLGADVTVSKGEVGLGNVTNDQQLKSINNDTTQAQAIAGGDDISVATTGGTTTVRRAAQTGGRAHWLFPLGSWFGSTVNNVITSANQVRTARVHLPFRITVNSIHFNIAVAVAGGLCSVGIYSDDGNTLLIDSGVKSTTSTGLASTTLAAPVTLAPGWYWIAYTCDNASSAISGASGSTAVSPVLNGATTHVGAAANTSSAGVLPATLGTISASSVVGVPYVNIQN